MDLRISKIGINEARKEKVAYPPLHNCVEEEGGPAGRLCLQRVEAAVHIDVDLLHPLREALELQKETQSPLASIKLFRDLDSVSAKQQSEKRRTEKRLRLDEDVLRPFTAA